MDAEIVAVGTELTTGAKLDTNSQWLSLALAECGLSTRFHSTVSDDLQAITDVLRAAVNRSDVVLITGGLGPTLDDVTRHALAALVQRELVLDEQALHHIESLFRRRNRSMSQRNRIQAMFPAGSEMLPNPRGTAPGIWMEVARKGRDNPSRVAALPGVPSEMKRMFEAEVRPRLPVGRRVIRRARVNCFGVGESTAEEILGDLTARNSEPDIGITVHEATITLRITAHGETAEVCEESIAAAKAEIRQRMGELVFGEEDEELEHVIAAELARRRLTLATAESGTGGLLAYRLSETPQQAECFCGGIVAANERQLWNQLMPESAETPSRMDNRRAVATRIAETVREKLQADFALSVLDCPEFNPDDLHADSPVTSVALADGRQSLALEVTLFGDPAIRKSRTVKSVLNLLRLHLRKIDVLPVRD